MPFGPSLPPKPYPEYGWDGTESEDAHNTSQYPVSNSSSQTQGNPYHSESTLQQVYGGSAPPNDSHPYTPAGGDSGDQLDTRADYRSLRESSDYSVEYDNGLSSSLDTLRQDLPHAKHNQAKPPPTSIWHQQGEPVASIKERRYREEFKEEKTNGHAALSPQAFQWQPVDASRPPSSMYPPSNDLNFAESASRPISTATGIISLYGDDWAQDSSSGSSSYEDERRPPQGHRVSRPLPAPPGSSTSFAPSLYSNHHEASQSGSFRLTPSSSQNSVRVPYAFSEASAANRGEYFDSIDAIRPSAASSSSSLPPMIASEGPVWSPTIPSTEHANTPSVRAQPQTSEGYLGYHRPQYSLGAGSSFGLDSGESSRDFTSGARRGHSTNHSVPHLQIDSSPSVQSLKRRAPLPNLPQSASQGSDLSDGFVQTSRAPAFSYPNDNREPTGYPEDNERPASVQSTLKTTIPSTARVPSSAFSKKGNSAQLNINDPQAFGTVITSDVLPANGVFEPYRDEKRGLTRDRHSHFRSVNYAVLSHLGVLLKETVPRAPQTKGSISYPSSFTGRDVVSTLYNQIPRRLLLAAVGLDDSIEEQPEQQAQLRRLVLYIAQSLNNQLFFHEVDWGADSLQDSVEQVYSFLDSSTALNLSRANSNPQMVRLPSNGVDASNLSDDISYDYATQGYHKRNHPVLSSDLEELPTGVFVPLTNCYSPLCGRSDAPPGSACYSPSCPRAKKSSLRRALTTAGLGQSGVGGGMDGTLPGMAGGPAHKAWAELMPKEVLDSLPKREVTRQNAILEHIQKEEDFLADLQLLESLFIKGLEKPSATGDPPPIPIGPDRDDFIREVFANHRELVWHVSKFVEALHIRQREESPIIQSIGDLFLGAALEWDTAFVTYVANYPIARSRIGREQNINPRFGQFMETCRRDPACRRLGLDNFIHRALPHLQRHPLLLQTIIDKTEEGNPDREICIRAKEIIVEQCKMADTVIQASQIKAQIRGFAYNLQTKRNKAVVDMDLLNEERQLIHEGRVYRKPDFTDLEWAEMQAILFDNFFAVTKLKSKQESDQSSNLAFVLAKRPIAVELLEVSGFNEPSVSYSIGLNAFHLRSDRESRDLWPFTIHHVGGKMEPLTLYATSKQRRNEWHNKFDEAKALRQTVVDANKAFEIATLSDSTFAIPTSLAAESTVAPMGADTNLFHGRITCAVPFRMADQRRLVALGCVDGVWIGLRNDPSSFRKVLHLKHVTQCAVMEDFGIFIVLADKILISYSLEALVPSSTGGAIQPRPPQKLSGNRGVLFFGVGVLKERTLLVYMKKKANESVFKALEPVINQPMASTGKSSGGLFTKIKNDISKSADWFRIYKVFFIPSEAYTIQFLRSKLAVVCSRGFEIMNLDTLLPGTVPDFTRSARDDPRILALARRVETAKPLGMFKLPDGESFLLCYDAFACYVDRGGEPIRLDNVVEWEGSPTSVAFSSPYILAMDSRFVEIREASSGRLVQVIRGYDVRYVSASSVVEGSAEAEPSIICVQRRRCQGKPYDEQVVFELVQTNPVPTASTGEARRGPFMLRQAVEVTANNEEQRQRQQQRGDLYRTNTSVTAMTSMSNGSIGTLSYSSTMSSTRSGSDRLGGEQSGWGGRGRGAAVLGSPTSTLADPAPTMRTQGSRGLQSGSAAASPAGWI